ncbi:class I SAM-dependent DNA methyltransferase [Texcoconibacillus texcoconensis]|uniref:Ubiquinone/menaquinone biosynthesis C-methylase UbiE n=1 Tax=Texcoconibacillus texcoconensis TaxID=1095777 RepID=A0A840QRQ2_9BACI|nr:class I SAM-dependent methyltransferase [Texcoconibacillus texcoconensis]MBB5173967.1 ubiquinone/menaquinone biosynthesis C-methylase UbiE [Texcoconibacillus texcoconensis]
MSYQQFAYIYDQLMTDAPYEQWLNFTRNYVKTPATILDVATGTGAIALMLAKEGYLVSAVDVSEDMLDVAKEKVEDAGVDVAFFQRDMRNMDGLGQYDAVTMFCDSLNYVLEETDVKQAFTRVYNHLCEGGTFLFDVHSREKIAQQINDRLYASNEEDISFVWVCEPGEYANMVEHDLSFFIQDDEEGGYRRVDEWHEQRTFSPEDYETWLREVGFEQVEISADFTEARPNGENERILFVAKKGY